MYREVCVGGCGRGCGRRCGRVWRREWRRVVHRDKEDSIIDMVVSHDSATTHLLFCIII